jgi:hypothetical protein
MSFLSSSSIPRSLKGTGGGHATSVSLPGGASFPLLKIINIKGGNNFSAE